MRVRPVERSDSVAWLEMRYELWPEGSRSEHSEEIDRYFEGRFAIEPWMVLVAEDGQGRPNGFVEISVRPFAEGCGTNNVAYLEGWFVRPEARGQGVGRQLVAAAEEWGRSQGCTEFASDTQSDNDTSVAAHRALGFEDAGLLRCFRKDL